MKLSLIVAAAENGVIGHNNQLPWYLPQDLKYFKTVTLGKPVIMGRKTYESIGKPLPGRVNIVVTRSKEWAAVEGVIVANSFEQALAEAKDALVGNPLANDEIMVIGGAEIYRCALRFADRIYLTRILAEPEGDAFFDSPGEPDWVMESKTVGDVLASVPHEFLVYVRCQS